MYRIVVFLFFVIFGFFPAGHAFGDEAPPTEAADGAAGPPSAVPSSSESDRDAEAKLQFETGREFFNQGRYEEAAIAMKRAFELGPSYKILYYLGWAEGETGNFARALNAYKGYLAEAPADSEADRIEEVKKAVEKLRAKTTTAISNPTRAPFARWALPRMCSSASLPRPRSPRSCSRSSPAIGRKRRSLVAIVFR